MNVYYVECKGSEIHPATGMEGMEIFYQSITEMYVVIAETPGKARYATVRWNGDVEFTSPISIRKIASGVDLNPNIYDLRKDENTDEEKTLWDLVSKKIWSKGDLPDGTVTCNQCGHCDDWGVAYPTGSSWHCDVGSPDEYMACPECGCTDLSDSEEEASDG